MAARQLSAYGLACAVPRGWDVRIERRVESRVLAPASDIPMGGFVHPILHAGSSPLPPVRGDYGSGFVERMRPSDVFVSLGEFDHEAGATDMFLDGQPLRLTADEFHPNAQQRIMARMCGTQRFFSVGGRAFCLYVVLGSWLNRGRLVPVVNSFLSGISIEPR